MDGAIAVEVGEVLADPFLAVMSAAECWGLLRLRCFAWRSPLCEIPADDRQLAVLSLLGDAWEGSQLRAQLDRWFVPAASGQLVCVALLERKRRELAWREKSAAGGRQSGVSRRAKGGSSTLTNHPSKGGSSTLPAPAAAAAEVTPAVASGTATEANATAKGGSSTLQRVVQDGPPRIPPEEKSLSQGDNLPGKGVRGTGTDLLGEPVKPRPPRRPTKDQLQEALQVVQSYDLHVGPEERGGEAAIRAVGSLLAAGHTLGELTKAARNYAQLCDVQGKEPRYRTFARNFYQPARGTWRVYAGAAPGVQPQSWEERCQRAAGPTCPPWFAAWARGHARRFSWSRSEDAETLGLWWSLFDRHKPTEAELAEASAWIASLPQHPPGRAQHPPRLIARIVDRRQATRTPASTPEQPATAEQMETLGKLMRGAI